MIPRGELVRLRRLQSGVSSAFMFGMPSCRHLRDRKIPGNIFSFFNLKFPLHLASTIYMTPSTCVENLPPPPSCSTVGVRNVNLYPTFVEKRIAEISIRIFRFRLDFSTFFFRLPPSDSPVACQLFDYLYVKSTTSIGESCITSIYDFPYCLWFSKIDDKSRLSLTCYLNGQFCRKHTYRCSLDTV